MITEIRFLTEFSSKILGGKFRDNKNFRDHGRFMARSGAG
jgi:hypothetical protein